MFGYVLPVKAELKVRDFERYRAVYCGLCKQLGKSYGLASRFLLNYDSVLLAVLADGLSGEAGCVKCEGCFANPIEKRPTLHETPGLALGADSLVMLSWHKLRDNLDDEKGGKRLLYGLASPFVEGMNKKAAAVQPDIAEVLTVQMDRQRALEKAGCNLIDEACDPTAQMSSALFAAAAQTGAEERVLRRMGLFCGQVVYLLDAAEDYDDDAKRNRYNVFLQMELDRQQAIDLTRQRCNMAAGEIALCYNLLTFKQYRDILDNIFFLGLPQGIAAAGIKRNKRGQQHGQITSV